jgi:hypothetical protein
VSRTGFDHIEEHLLISLFYVATALFLANFVLGVAVQMDFVDKKPFRCLHHALFFLAFVSAVVATLLGFVFWASYRWTLLPVLLLFAVLPYVRAGTLGHAALACCAFVLYAASFLQTL